MPRPQFDSQLKLYNTRTRKIEAFVPLDGEVVRIYVCGLTPSAQAHLGHARSFMFFDVVRRYLTHCGYRVTYVQNVTDIDDRSIREAKDSDVPWQAVVEKYFSSFKRSMDRLRVLEPDREPRATEYIPQIVTMIGELVARGNAYATRDGVYFAVSSFPRYGALSGRNTDELLIGARIAPDEGKRDPLDFALWKFAKPDEPSWESPWGAGRPGWHIECSAMSHALLGEPFDIHGGGYDLIFPHHENEIAQTESLVAPPMANVWMHGGLLQFDGKKMSKSLGNFEPLYELLDRHDPQAIRLLFLGAGYRKPMNFTEASIASARSGLERILSGYDKLRHAAPAPHDRAAEEAAVAEYRAQFYAFMNDDFNTSGATAVLFGIASGADDAIARGIGSGLAAFVHEAMTMLGISPNERAKLASRELTMTTATHDSVEYKITRKGAEHLRDDAIERLRLLVGEIVPLQALDGHETVDAVVKARIVAKSQKDFALADRLRVALAEAGVTLADSKEGTSWSVGV